MATHYLKGSGVFAGLFGVGWVETLCGTEVPAKNGPDSADSLDCRKCAELHDGSKLFWGLF
jgi:hypothetical protein